MKIGFAAAIVTFSLLLACALALASSADEFAGTSITPAVLEAESWTQPDAAAAPAAAFAGITAAWWSAAQDDIRASEYRITWQEDSDLPGLAAAYQAPNRSHNLRTYFTFDGIRVLPRQANEGRMWQLTLALSGYGATAAVKPMGQPGELVASENRIEYGYAGTQGLSVWYINDARGLEQGFTLAAPPASSQEAGPAGSALVIELAISGVTPVLVDDGSAIEFRDTAGQAVLRCAGLSAVDAVGRSLPARMTLSGCQPDGGLAACRLQLILDPSGSDYPLTVDSHITGLPASYDWRVTGDSFSTEFGFAVATAGDVNGDGYDDVIVGDRSYDNGAANEGAAFVFYGSASGLATSPGWSAESNQETGRLGYSVAGAGDVNGDGYADVIVGAFRYDSVGLLDNGAAFIWHGASDGVNHGVAGTPANAAWMGRAWIATADFGATVSSAGDINGDGYADVIVGAPRYSDPDTSEGRVSVFLGSAAGVSTTEHWSAESNQYAARLGGSVAAAGDVNGDGYADIAIGAPWYDAGQVDEGRIFIVRGSASGLSCGAGCPVDISTAANWTAESNSTGAWLGWALSTAGDVNGDCYSDLIAGAQHYTATLTEQGAAYVYLGAASSMPATPAWTTYGAGQASAHFGIAVGTAGDVNGDGYADVVVGQRDYDGADSTDIGRAYVYLGSASGLGSSPVWTANGEIPYDGYGGAVSTAGDVNGDGYADLLIGAAGFDVIPVQRGAAYVYLGASSGLATAAAWAGAGNQQYDDFGIAVGAAGDVNDDGYADIIVGAPSYDSGQVDEGRAFVYHGAADGPPSLAWTAESDQAGALFGSAVGTAGDVNGDGYADIIIGAHDFANGQAGEGRAFVYHGSVAGLSTTPAWTSEGDQVDASFGCSVGTAGDVNGDGYADVIVGADAYDTAEPNAGRVYVYHGSALGLHTTTAWTLEGNEADARVGNAVGTAGDINGDGYADVIIGARNHDGAQQDMGWVYVYYGSAVGLRATAVWILEGDQESAHFGRSVGTAGDVNGDGYADVIVGADAYDNGQSDEGRAFVYHGSAAGLGTTANWTAESNQEGAQFGYSVGTANDVNGDGYADVIIGAHDYDGGQTNEGRVYVYHGAASGLGTTAAWMAESDQAGAGFGYSVGTVGDVNGDGYADAIAGAPWYNDGQGAAFIYYGNASDGLEVRLQTRRADDSGLVAPGGQSISPIGVRLAAVGRTPFGRNNVALEWEIKPEATAFAGTGLGRSTWYDSSTTGYGFHELVNTLSFEQRYHWRGRIVAQPRNAHSSSLVTYRSRWFYGGAFFTALSGQQSVGYLGQTYLLGQSSYVYVWDQGTTPLTTLTLRGYPDTAHAEEGWIAGGDPVLNRYYSLTPNTGAQAEFDLCLAYADAEVPVSVSENTLRLCSWSGTAWACATRGSGSSVITNIVCAEDQSPATADWVIGYIQPAVAPTITATRSGSDLTLSWVHSPINTAGYWIWKSPYPWCSFSNQPPECLPYRVAAPTSSALFAGSVGDGLSDFYMVQGINGAWEVSDPSNRLGEFEFTLVPGTR